MSDCLKKENPKCPGVDSDSGAICDLCNNYMRRRSKERKPKSKAKKYGVCHAIAKEQWERRNAKG